jgi:hypothetical protein
MKCLSQIVTIARGSIGGLTFTANQHHQLIVRAKTSPVNPATNWQTKVRSQFSQGLNRWNTLEEDERQLWNAYAQTCQYNGPLGTYTVPGRLLFIATYTLVTYCNLFRVTPSTWADDPPSIPGWLSLNNLSSGAGTPTETGVHYDYTNNNGEDIVVLGQISQAFNASRTSFKGPWLTPDNLLDEVADSAAGSVEWQGLSAGQRYFSRFRCMSDQEPYRISNDMFMSALAELWTV